MEAHSAHPAKATSKTIVPLAMDRSSGASLPVMEEIVTSGGLERLSHWYPIFDAPSKHAHRSRSGRAALADVVQIDFGNENNVFGELGWITTSMTWQNWLDHREPNPVDDGDQINASRAAFLAMALCPCLASLYPPAFGWFFLGFREIVLDFARGNIQRELGKLVWIAGAFHASNMPRAETLPALLISN